MSQNITMDIRKFFGPQGAVKKPNQPQKEKKKTPESHSAKKEKIVASKNDKSASKNGSKRKRESSSPSKLTAGKTALSKEETVVIDDCSDDEVIKSSAGSQQNGHKLRAKQETISDTSKLSQSSSQPKQSTKASKHGVKRSASPESDEIIEIESVQSSGSSSKSKKTSDDLKVQNRSSSKAKGANTPEKKSTESKLERVETPVRSSPRKQKSSQKEPESSEDPVPSAKSRSKSKNEDSIEIPVRSSPRKTNSKSVEKKKSRKRSLSSGDEEDEVKTKKPKGYKFDSEESDDEEVITSRKNRNGKAKGNLSKKVSRVLDSDSEEEPLPETKPKPNKRKKKEPVSYVADSDEEEKKLTALDKFVIHNAKTPTDEAKKREAEKSQTTPKEKPVNVLDFFGGGSASRSSRTTAVAKRNQEVVEEKKNESQVSVDLTFDEEMHEDDDFMKALDQLDGPDVKKVKQTENSDEKRSPQKAKDAGTLASKLAGKMKQTSPEGSSKPGSAEDKKRNTTGSPTKSPAGKSEAKASPKKGRVYTMEVTRVKPPTVIVSPGNTKKQESITPPKPPPPKAAKSMEKQKEGDEEDDGFGGPKGIKGFQAFKQRGGPQALGSKEIPEGGENCLEGLTFVITGVLDSIDRDDAKSLVERHGGKVTGSVSGRTSYLVVGREPGDSKVKKAAQLKVKELDEDGLFDLIRTLPGKTSKYEIQAKEQLKKEASIKAEKEKEDQKKATAAKKLESFRSDKDTRSTSLPSAADASSPSPKKQASSVFTQLKESSDTTSSSSSSSATTAPSPASSAKLLSQTQSPAHKGIGGSLDPGSKVKVEEGSEEPQTQLWVDKHKPTSMKQIIGQQGDKSNARRLHTWLRAWHQNVIVKGLKPAGNFFNKGGGDGAGFRAALLSGPPGIGKTTTATLVCQELGFSYVELNASDTRSKRSLKEVVAESLDNTTLVDFTGQHRSSSNSDLQSGQSHCLIMDEVDGMAGNEDRGGLQELVQLIKKSKIPIICICNDRNSMKMRTLSNYCLDLRFQRPRVEQIKGAMMSLAFKEGLKIPPAALNEIILASNHDIRQVIHNMSVWSAGNKTLTFDQVKSDAQKAQKDIKLGPFDVCRKVFVNDDETRKMSLNDKSDLFFHDYSFGPLFVHENYPKVIPNKASGHQGKHMSCLARSIDSICDGDLVDKLIRREGNWNLLPTQAMFSSVIPGETMRGSFPQMTDFPQWLGKFSSTNKTHRIVQELSTHMGLEVSCDKRGLTLDYLPALRACLTQPLVTQGSEGVPDVIKVMDDYDIIKEDFDNILEVTKWQGGSDPMAKLDPKTKAAFTRQYNKEIHMTPYATGATGGKKKKARGAPMEEEMLMEEGGEEGTAVQHSDEEEEDDGLEANSMIKTKKAPAAKAKGGGGGGGAGKGGQNSSSAKGKGKGKGSKK